MFQDKLDDMAAFIMEHNTYFDEAYSHVWMDEKRGFIADDKIVFPNDTLGSYFYLRLVKDVQFEYNNIYRFSQCVDGIGAKTPVILVAVVKGGDSTKVLRNMVNTLRNYKDVRIRSGIYQSEYVILQELSRVSEETQLVALQRLPKGSAIVSLTLDITQRVDDYKLNCIVDPCKC